MVVKQFQTNIQYLLNLWKNYGDEYEMNIE